MKQNISPLAIAAFMAIYLIVVGCLLRGMWRSFVWQMPGKKFNYHISDLWAAIVGLTPSFLVISCGSGQYERWVLLCAFMAPVAQLGGMFAGRLWMLRNFSDDSPAFSACCILCGALVGALLVPLYLLAFYTVLPAVFVYTVLYVGCNARRASR